MGQRQLDVHEYDGKLKGDYLELVEWDERHLTELPDFDHSMEELRQLFHETLAGPEFQTSMQLWSRMMNDRRGNYDPTNDISFEEIMPRVWRFYRLVDDEDDRAVFVQQFLDIQKGMCPQGRAGARLYQLYRMWIDVMRAAVDGETPVPDRMGELLTVESQKILRPPGESKSPVEERDSKETDSVASDDTINITPAEFQAAVDADIDDAYFDREFGTNVGWQTMPPLPPIDEAGDHDFDQWPDAKEFDAAFDGFEEIDLNGSGNPAEKEEVGEDLYADPNADDKVVIVPPPENAVEIGQLVQEALELAGPEYF